MVRERGRKAEYLDDVRKNLVVNRQKEYNKVVEVLGKYAPSYQRYHESLKNKNVSKNLETLIRDVSRLKRKLANPIENYNYKPVVTGQPSGSVVNYQNGKPNNVIFLGSTGKSMSSVDLTHHSNPKTHPIAPHSHDWETLSGGLIRKQKGYRIPTQAELIATDKYWNKEK